jgi:hypothetical protein
MWSRSWLMFEPRLSVRSVPPKATAAVRSALLRLFDHFDLRPETPGAGEYGAVPYAHPIYIVPVLRGDAPTAPLFGAAKKASVDQPSEEPVAVRHGKCLDP